MNLLDYRQKPWRQFASLSWSKLDPTTQVDNLQAGSPQKGNN